MREDTVGLIIVGLCVLLYVVLLCFAFSNQDKIKEKESVCSKLCGIAKFSVENLNGKEICFCLTEEGWKEKK